MARVRTEYLIEAAALATFMVSACVFGTVIFHPGSPVGRILHEPWMRRAVMGILMGLTAVTIIYSPWGKRSGAHMNPALTITFFRLGRVAPRDAAHYVAAQFAGAILGVLIARLLVGAPLADPAVHYVVTRPGMAGVAAAFAGELVISMVLMLTVLSMSASPRVARFTGLVAGALVALFITFEDPLSGMSMNPARTFGSAVVARDWTALWLYFTAPLAGMMLAAHLHLRVMRRAVACPKLAHAEPCLFCQYVGRRSRPGTAEGRRRPQTTATTTSTAYDADYTDWNGDTADTPTPTAKDSC
jgi:aquaporin Z